jgi:hypothetical protein
MAEVGFVVQTEAVMNATLVVAGPLAAGDTTSVLTINEGDSDVSVHVYGTVGGSTVTIVGAFTGITYGVLDDAYGSPLSFTSLGVIKPVGPAVAFIKGVVTGGAGVAVFIEVYITRRR